MKRKFSFVTGCVLGIAATIGFISLVAATPTEEISPVKARANEVYFPNTEDLRPDEMRVIACGTGMPTTRAAQAAACFLVELGNGDKFLFDIGSGSAERISSAADPIQLSRQGLYRPPAHRPLRSTARPVHRRRADGPQRTAAGVGTERFARRSSAPRTRSIIMQKMLTWDLAGRAGNVDFRGYQMEVNEFDFKLDQRGRSIEENGVTIRTFPAIHAIDGSVSYSLEWNGLKFVFSSSDTYPNTWFVEYAQDADLVMSRVLHSRPRSGQQDGLLS